MTRWNMESIYDVALNWIRDNLLVIERIRIASAFESLYKWIRRENHREAAILSVATTTPFCLHLERIAV